MARLVRMYLAAEVVVFGVASLLHTGALLPGYAHAAARTAEAVIALVLAVGLVVSLAAPGATRRAGLAAQGFALLGTAVGLFTIAVGVGPRTALDLTLHVAMIILLVSGLRAALLRHRPR